MLLVSIVQLFTTENWDRVLDETISSFGYYSEQIPDSIIVSVSAYYLIVVVVGGRILS